MKAWPVQDAKAKFSELLNTVCNEGAQVLTKRGERVAVVVPIAQWERLNSQRVTLKDLLLTNESQVDLALPVRGEAKHRETVTL